MDKRTEVAGYRGSMHGKRNIFKFSVLSWWYTKQVTRNAAYHRVGVPRVPLSRGGRLTYIHSVPVCSECRTSQSYTAANLCKCENSVGIRRNVFGTSLANKVHSQSCKAVFVSWVSFPIEFQWYNSPHGCRRCRSRTDTLTLACNSRFLLSVGDILKILGNITIIGK